ncbi:hypothetical protein [Sagittula sp. P11]|uniref:hypothetical protein n=1 Tax=Sagittula sp. P11 TaxID=2009329 RepID=UPI0012FDF26E|nr:hypothetical protein [Sagittula sp. P11]
MRTNGNCTMMSWGIAAALGVFAFLLLVGSYGFGTALFLGIVTLVLLGLLFQWLFCAPLPEKGETGVTAGQAGGNGTSATSPGATAASAGVAAASSASASAKSAPAAEPAPEPKAQPETSPETAPEAETASSASAEPAAEETPEKASGADEPVAESAAPATTASAEPAPKSAPKDKGKEASGDEGGSRVKPSTQLAGEADLAGRKGSWTYKNSADADDTTLAGSTDGAAGSVDSAGSGGDGAEVMTAPDGAEADAPGSDGKGGDSGEGSKPALLDAPEGGKPDDLKQIKGIGPKLEKVCHSIGVYHFHQIASWTDEEVAWADANLVGFRGRVSRDNWVSQAKVLADGGETEFSTRVEKGGVYD